MVTLLLTYPHVPVHRLNVLDPVEEPQRLTAADARGGLAMALLRSGACPARKPLAFPGAVNGTQKRGGGRVEVGGGKSLY